jgi:SAM-dependent methyltransferase
MDNPEIRSENSAQRKDAPPNPFVEKTISYLKASAFGERDVSNLRVADQGCGNLRHLEILQRSFKHLFFVDTPFQIRRTHKIGTEETTLGDYAAKLNRQGNRYHLLDNAAFKDAKLNLDVILCACVLDVVPAKVRRELVIAAASNLKRGGYYCVIVPRNDQTITSRCTSSNAYQDGHIFRRGQLATFYANFSNESAPLKSLYKLLASAGLKSAADLSIYRHLCLILRRELEEQ